MLKNDLMIKLIVLFVFFFITSCDTHPTAQSHQILTVEQVENERLAFLTKNLEHYQKKALAAPGDDNSWWQLILTFDELGDPRYLETISKRINTTRHPVYKARFLGHRALYHEINGDYAMALQDFKVAAIQRPKSSTILAPRYERFELSKARIFEKLGDPQSAFDILDALIHASQIRINSSLSSEFLIARHQLYLNEKDRLEDLINNPSPELSSPSNFYDPEGKRPHLFKDKCDSACCRSNRKVTIHYKQL